MGPARGEGIERVDAGKLGPIFRARLLPKQRAQSQGAKTGAAPDQELAA